MFGLISYPLIDLSHTIDDVKYRTDLILAPWDDHTYARGPSLLADGLFRTFHDREGHCLLRSHSAVAAP